MIFLGDYMKLVFSALTKFLAGLFLVGALLFLPAGGFDFWNAWLLVAILFVPMLILGIILCFKSPKLLEKRMNTNEKETIQKVVVAVSGVMFVFGFVVAALDHRFGWSNVPLWLVILSSVLFFVSYLLYAEVMRENAYLSRTVEVCRDQKVIDTGLYGIVRHPMYAVTVLMFLSMPLVLGSWWSFLCFLPYVFVVEIRIRNEEKMLEKEFLGYAEYKKRVKYKILPYVW